jgi:tetratricopeptide (TPR) repeat protein
MRIIIALIFIVLLFTVFYSTSYPGDSNFGDILNKAQTLTENKQYTKAEAVLRSFTGKLPTNQDMQDRFNYDLGRSLLGQKRFSEAVPLLRSYCEYAMDRTLQRHTITPCPPVFREPQGGNRSIFESAKTDKGLAPEALYYTGIAYLKLGSTQAQRPPSGRHQNRSSPSSRCRHA